MNNEAKEFNLGLLLSNFEIPFKEMKEADLEYSYQVWSSWLSFLRGPKKRPTDVKCQSLKLAIEFLSGQWTSEDSRRLESIRERSQHFGSITSILDNQSVPSSPFCCAIGNDEDPYT